MPSNHTPTSDIPLKRCNCCKEEKPATTEFFTHRNYVPDGLFATCKTCRQKKQSERRAASKESFNAKIRTKYNPDKRRQSYLAQKERVAETCRARYEANKDRVSRRTRAWREANKERVAKQNRVWYENNRDLARNQVQRRRARKLAAEGTHTAADIAIQYGRQCGCCYWCGIDLYGGYHIDHVAPLSRGGSNWPSNIVIACVSCNESKGAKLPHEWCQQFHAEWRETNP